MPKHFPPLLLPLILVTLTGHMALSGGRLSGSLYALSVGSPELVVGIFMAMFSVLPALAAMSIGRWVDRMGALPVIRLGVLAVLIGALVPVLWLSVPSLFVMAVLIGFGFNAMSVASQHTVGAMAQGKTAEQRLRNFGWYALGHSASSALGPFISGLLIDHIGFRTAFATMAGFTCVACWLVFKRLRKLPAAAKSEAAGDDQPKPQAWHDLLAAPELRRIYYVSMALACTWDLFIVMLPVLGTRLGFSASVIGTVFSLFAVGTFVSRALMPWLSTRFREWQIMRAAMVIIALVFILLPWASAAAAFMLLGFLFGTSVGFSQPNMLSLLHAAAPGGRGGEALGLRSLIGNSSSVMVPIAFGLAVGPLGVAPLLWAGATLISSALPAAHRGVRHHLG
ncbi:MAG: MFS transporter [Rhodoferax sp.]|uniref:MFS transporter n=1 Tax=Rhodoferax sp. TaxID=50421 RepID=UPI00261BC5A7|nr:MFS transporter [Rhodoferax sp.]MDD5333322.1 MFS transporter [Rhodoferax sp.]